MFCRDAASPQFPAVNHAIYAKKELRKKKWRVNMRVKQPHCNQRKMVEVLPQNILWALFPVWMGRKKKLNKHIFRVICYQSKWIKITYILQWTAKPVCCQKNDFFPFLNRDAFSDEKKKYILRIQSSSNICVYIFVFTIQPLKFSNINIKCCHTNIQANIGSSNFINSNFIDKMSMCHNNHRIFV